MAVNLSSTRVHQLQLREGSLDVLLDQLPVDLEFLFGFGGLVVDDDRVREVLFSHDEISLVIEAILTFLLLVGCRSVLTNGFRIALAHFCYREFKVILAADFEFVFAHVELLGVVARISNFVTGDVQALDFVAVQEVANVDPAFFVSLDLLAEEFIFC